VSSEQKKKEELTENMARKASPTHVAIFAPPYRNIVCSVQNSNILDQPFSLCSLSRQTEVKPITSVIGNQQDNSLLRRSHSNRGQDLFRTGRCENITTCNC
jgi:hypothetical protein